MSGLNERSKRQIALLAGDDLEGLAAEEARRSVESCPHCRGHWTRVRGCLDALDRAGKAAEPRSEASLWPALERRLTAQVVRTPARFNGWVPALSMAAACIALLIAGQMDATPPRYPDDGHFVAGPLTLSPASFPVVRPSREAYPARRADTFPGFETPEDFETPNGRSAPKGFLSPDGGLYE